MEFAQSNGGTGVRVPQPLRAIAVNLALSLVAYAIVRAWDYRHNQALIDCVVLASSSTAHFWYLKESELRRKFLIALISATVNAGGLFMYVLVVLREAL